MQQQFAKCIDTTPLVISVILGLTRRGSTVLSIARSDASGPGKK
jgi:hypothetical protein